jgi:uncharacterized membrane protein YhaH (DUF805 family)
MKLLWSLNGRIGRVAYAGGLLLNWVLMLIVLAVWQILVDNWTPPEPFNLKDGSLLVLVPFAVLFCWVHFALTVKRLHDLGVTGLLSLLLLVPPALLIMPIVLLIARGEDNDNRYGPGAPSARAPAPAHHA